MSDDEPDLPAATPTSTAVMLSCIAIWGVNAVAFKVATKPSTGVGFDPVFMHGLRFLIVAPIVAGMVSAMRPGTLRITDRRDLVRYAIFGFFAIPIGETLQTFALRYTSVANLTLISHGTISLFTALWAALLGQQTLRRVGWVGAVIAFIGVGVVAASGSGGLRIDTGSLLGDGIALTRSVVHALYLLNLARFLRQRPVLAISVYNCVFGALWLLPYVLWRAPSFPWRQVPNEAWIALAWTILPATVYGFLAWNWGMSRVGAVAATNLFYLMPVSAALAAWLLLGEPVRPGQLLGGIVIVCGIVLLRWETLAAVGVSLSLPRRWRREDE